MKDAGSGLDILIHGKKQKDSETEKVTFQVEGQTLDETMFRDIGGQLSKTLQRAHVTKSSRNGHSA